MTIHQHVRSLPERKRFIVVDGFIPYHERFIHQFGHIDPKATVDAIDNEGFE